MSLPGTHRQLARFLVEDREHGLAGDRSLADGNPRHRMFGQIYVKSRSEPNQANTFTGDNFAVLADEAFYPPGHKAGDLHHRHLAMGGRKLSVLALSSSAFMNAPGR